MRPLIILTLFFFCSLAIAQEEAMPPPPMEDSDLPELENAPPPTVESSIQRETQEPEIRITERRDKTITEYSKNGVVYMVKVTPKHAPAYYLIDNDGDGDLETRQDDLTVDMAIPTWVIKRW